MMMKSSPSGPRASRQRKSSSKAQLKSSDVRHALKEALKGKIESWGVNQEEAANRFHVSRPYLNSLLNNKRTASTDKLIELADDAGLTVRVIIED